MVGTLDNVIKGKERYLRLVGKVRMEFGTPSGMERDLAPTLGPSKPN